MQTKLKRLVRRHAKSPWQKPVADHTRKAFEQSLPQLLSARQSGQSLWLDSCCGVGASTYHIARQHPDYWVLGIDKSEHRLSKAHGHSTQGVRNCQLVRADCVDLWYLLHQAGICYDEHSLWYPNPWPKSTHMQRRWYAMPIMSILVQLQKRLTVRSNMLWYLEDFAWALRWWGFDPVVKPLEVHGPAATPFEKKYSESGQMLWELGCIFD